MAVLMDTKARHIKPDDKPLLHGRITGLTLHPSSVKGRGKWVFRYVSPVTQKRRNAGLGTYPEVSIAEAARINAGYLLPPALTTKAKRNTRDARIWCIY